MTIDNPATLALALVILTLAVARVTRLVNSDKISDPIRVAIASRVRHHTLIAAEAEAHNQSQRAAEAHRREARWAGVYEFVQCPWCIGMWVSLGGAAVLVWVIKYSWTIDWWALLPVALAVSHLVGVLARFADTEEIEIEDAAEDELDD
ncbi:hypothetical protein SEA_MEGATRON_7 [Mycobacterium phage Megatron]|nr:hypothetical protein SEA_MEGATRON_7 [Mycobacterium phage Megatron]